MAPLIVGYDPPAPKMIRIAALQLVIVAALGLTAYATTADQSKAAPEPIRSGFGKGAYPYGTVFPALQSTKEPLYPASAIAAGLEGEVLLEAVVGTKGSVTDVRVVKSLDTNYGLDASAVEAVRAWKFLPGTIVGQEVPVVVKARVIFHLHAPGTASGAPSTESGLVGSDEPSSQTDDRRMPNSYALSTPGLTRPTVTRSPRPAYTSAAMREKIQGSVELEVIVGVKGTVTDVRVVKSLDASYGLDEQAVRTARAWTFTPCRLKGQAVPCTITLQLEFKLH